MDKREQTQNTVNHTPTPWKVLNAQAVDQDGWAICAAREKKVIKQNAEFIVRACNAHDALVEACKEAWEVLEPRTHSRARRCIKEALTKAGGKS